MKDTNHPIRHPRVHRGGRASAQRSESYVRQDAQDGRGMAPCWAGATPLFATGSWPKDHWGRSSPINRTSSQNVSFLLVPVALLILGLNLTRPSHANAQPPQQSPIGFGGRLQRR